MWSNDTVLQSDQVIRLLWDRSIRKIEKCQTTLRREIHELFRGVEDRLRPRICLRRVIPRARLVVPDSYVGSRPIQPRGERRPRAGKRRPQRTGKVGVNVQRGAIGRPADLSGGAGVGRPDLE